MNNISVSTLVRYLKNKLDSDENIQSVFVVGEITNFRKHVSGHLYFSLKDEKASISCVMFSSYASSNKFFPKNGDRVVVYAKTSIFETSGQLQLYVSSMKLDGIGNLYQQYELLKNTLAKEGYFNDDHKKEFDILYPERIAVLCGDKSAAMSDIKKQFKRRWPLCKVDYYPVIVQGKEAPINIINKLKEVDMLNYEAIVLARGGGSFEDLFCFNDEMLVKTIYNLNTFIITGIGHEQDYTLVDFVADKRALTPTAAIEMITPDINDILVEIDDYEQMIKRNIDKLYSFYETYIDELSNNKYLLNPNLLIENKMLKLDYYFSKLHLFSNKLDSINLDISNTINNMALIVKNKLNKTDLLIDSKISILNAYSVNNNLKKGYSIIYKDEKIVNNKKHLKNNDEIKIMMFDGNISAQIKEK